MKENPRYLADFNGDGKADIVGFSHDGVLVSLSTACTENPSVWGDFLLQNLRMRIMDMLQDGVRIITFVSWVM